MNVINVYEPMERGEAVSMAPRPAPRPMSGNVFTLRRSGARPISFGGRLLGHHNGYRVGTPMWHELNLYQMDDGRYVADIRVFAKAQGAKDQFHVAVVDSMEEALQVFEGHDARGDVSADIALDDEALSPAELVVQAAALKAKLADSVASYRSVVASFLTELNRG